MNASPIGLGRRLGDDVPWTEGEAVQEDRMRHSVIGGDVTPPYRSGMGGAQVPTLSSARHETSPCSVRSLTALQYGGACGAVLVDNGPGTSGILHRNRFQRSSASTSASTAAGVSPQWSSLSCIRGLIRIIRGLNRSRFRRRCIQSRTWCAVS